MTDAPAAGEVLGDGGADALGGTGDESYFIGEFGGIDRGHVRIELGVAVMSWEEGHKRRRRRKRSFGSLCVFVLFAAKNQADWWAGSGGATGAVLRPPNFWSTW